MMMSTIQRRMVILCCLAILALIARFLFAAPIAPAHATAQDNSATPPVVKILAPQDKSVHKWNTLVNYQIVVTDRGKSTQYQEIPSNQVLLQTTYVPDLSHLPVHSPRPAIASAGLADIMGSNCLGCHEFKAKAMGPSFAAIAKHYPETASTIDALSRHIREGSAGVWGPSPMPPHPGLTAQQSHDISLWIMKDAADPDVNDYVGTEGSFSMRATGTPGHHSGLILTASYTRPDATTPQQQIARGEDTMVVEGK